MRIVTVLSTLSALTIAASWASAGEMATDQRAVLCDQAIIQVITRYNGKPHDRDECIRGPDAYLEKIVAENQADSARIVKKKQAARSIPTKFKPDAYIACRMAITRKSRFPNSAEFSLSGVRNWTCGGRACVAGNVSLKNGLGIMVQQSYYCEVSGDTVLKAQILPGPLR